MVDWYEKAVVRSFREAESKKHCQQRTISMKSAMILWNHWSQHVNALFPTQHGHQQKSLALLVQGIVIQAVRCCYVAA
jgi:uncharacterized membrane-anchored protein